MANGNTTQILNGNVTTLKEYASVLAKGFGAMSHQQNEPLNTPIREAVVNEEHNKEKRALKRSLKKFNAITDEELIADEKKALVASKAHYKEKIVTMKAAKKKCSALLLEAQLWEIPTENHQVVKDLMIKELKDVIDFDCDLEPVNQLIKDIDNRMDNIDPADIRKKQVEAFEKQIDFREQSHNVDKDHVEQSNIWVSELISSFE